MATQFDDPPTGTCGGVHTTVTVGGRFAAAGAGGGGGLGVTTGGAGGGVGSGFGARGAHDAAMSAASTIKARSAREKMWVIYLEAGVALAVLLLIVWWTWPKNKK